jgi:hypothetical protein
MRNHVKRIGFLLPLGALASILIASWTILAQGQPPLELPPQLPAVEVKAPGPPSTAVRPASSTQPATSTIATPKQRRPVAFDRYRNLSKLPELTRQIVIATSTGMRWLSRYNQENGLFLHGYLPALNRPMEGDHLLHQAMAAFTLARAARFSGDEQYAAQANQAVLALLCSSAPDPMIPGTRRPAQPSLLCNRLAAAGFMVMAIHELPDPATDLLDKAEELLAFIRLQQGPDGSLSYVDAGDDPATAEPDGINRYPGPALFAIALSQRARPAAWKLVAIRKAAGFYRNWFHDHPQPDLVPWMTAACTEAYLATKDKFYAEFALEMNDWLMRLQYAESPDPRRPFWRGGFKAPLLGRAEAPPPGIEAALYAQSLADACRLIGQMSSPDLTRYEQYRTALWRALEFLTTLQFTEANTQHFAPGYRNLLLGGFHPTHNDGNLRVDQSAAAVSAFIQFLVSGADSTK